MNCKICHENFFRGTSTLPFNDICSDCHDKYVIYEEVKRTPKEQIDYCNYIIKSFQDENIKLEKTIKENESLIQDFINTRDQIIL